MHVFVAASVLIAIVVVVFDLSLFALLFTCLSWFVLPSADSVIFAASVVNLSFPFFFFFSVPEIHWHVAGTLSNQQTNVLFHLLLLLPFFFL